MFIIANCLLVPLLKVNDLVDIVSQVDSPTNMDLDVQVPLFINIGQGKNPLKNSYFWPKTPILALFNPFFKENFWQFSAKGFLAK